MTPPHLERGFVAALGLNPSPIGGNQIDCSTIGEQRLNSRIVSLPSLILAH